MSHNDTQETKSLSSSFQISVALFLFLLLGVSSQALGNPLVVNDAEHKLITISDGDGELTLRLNYNSGCVLDQINIRDRNVAASTGAYTGIQMGNEWLTTRNAADVRVKAGANRVTVSGISYGQPNHEVEESWKFTALADKVTWQITRKYTAAETVKDMAFPEWNFNPQSWTGGLLDNGGVVWNKYLDRANATYGGHFEMVTFWNAQSNDCLRITPQFDLKMFGAGRFSRQTNGDVSFNYSISDERLKTQHGQSRFLSGHQDLWEPVQVGPSEVTAEFTLQVLDYDKTYGRGTFVGLDGNNLGELLNTVARYGVIDSQLVGGNGWRSGYICLHEPFFAQIGATVDAADYINNYSAALDYYRDQAITTNGRVKSRWCYGPGDAMRGTYDQNGFYEAQWGYLLDSQPDYVMNVAEQFNLTGDRTWLAGHKDSCERALEFLMRREVGNSGLVSMMTDSCKQARGSDWIDIIWASYENAFVNAQLYAALNLWADAEDALNDPNKARNYREFAARLKSSFNQPVSDGGFWDPTNQWYVYWRDQDGSIHGNNLTTPVNFAAIAYGLCDDPARQKSILDRMEAEMKKENLFYWPLCFFSYEPEEGAKSNFPFPKYENGDIFLSWGELGVRAYSAYEPELALKYVKNTLTRYAADGLSYQRYLRQSQRGEGDDILAGNCMPVVGLYRDIYGIQPKPNRLFLDPHMTSELVGTRLRYMLRGTNYEISPGTNTSSVVVDNYSVEAANPFGVNATGQGLQYFCGRSTDWAMSVSTPSDLHLNIQIQSWPDVNDVPREWTEAATQGQGKISYLIQGLVPHSIYQLSFDSVAAKKLEADKSGQIKFKHEANSARPVRLSIALVN